MLSHDTQKEKLIMTLAAEALSFSTSDCKVLVTWLFSETWKYYQYHAAYPTGRKCEDVVDNVYDLVLRNELPISYQAVYEHYTKNLSAYIAACSEI